MELPPCLFGAQGALPCGYCDASCAHSCVETQPTCALGKDTFLPCYDCHPGCAWYARAGVIATAREVGRWPDGASYDTNPYGLPRETVEAMARAGSGAWESDGLDDGSSEGEGPPAWLDEHGEPIEFPLEGPETAQVAPPHTPPVAPSLSEAQLAVVEHRDGPALVMSGAGSGKTTTVTSRIVRLCSTGVHPEKILGLTFTRKAAREMRERIARALPSVARKVTLITFHSLALLLCRDHPTLVGRKARFGVWDDKLMASEMRRALSEAIGETEVDDEEESDGEATRVVVRLDEGDKKPTTASCLKAIEFCRERDLDLETADLSRVNGARNSAVTRIAVLNYERSKIASNAMDYIDLVWSAWRLLSRHDEVRATVQSRFTHVMVDEYQDTNDLQERLLALIVGEARNLVVVGDEDQAIYKFRGSNSIFIRSFTDRYPGARVYPLGQNYRSAASVVQAAANVITFNEDRRADKRIWTENPSGLPVGILRSREQSDEAYEVARRLESSIREGRSPEDHVVLVRTRRQFGPIQSALRSLGVDYVTVGGVDHMQRPDVRRVLAWFRLLVNPLDIGTGAHILGHWPRFGAATVQVWLHQVRVTEGPVFAQLGALSRLPGLGGHTKRGQSLVDLIEAWAELQRRVREDGASIRDHALWLYGVTGLDEEIDALISDDNDKKSWEEGYSRKRLKQDFIEACPADPVPGSGVLPLIAFLDAFTLNADAARREGGKVVLSTIHGAKGLEWPVVFVVGVVEGTLPYAAGVDLQPQPGRCDVKYVARIEKEDLEEERRLMYVAMTRARDVLVLSWFDELTHPRRDNSKACSSSRFLEELAYGRSEREAREAEAIMNGLQRRYADRRSDRPEDASRKESIRTEGDSAFRLGDILRLRRTAQQDDVPSTTPPSGKIRVGRR